MAVRVTKQLPRRWKERSRDLYVTLGRTTAPWRLLPSFVMVGASRAGTTSLFRALSAHPQVIRPTVNKGIRYFDLNYYRPFDWYRAHFPLAPAAHRLNSGEQPVTFEASGYYMFHPFAIQRLAKHLPDVNIVVMVRDPVERAFSAWKHESGRGFEWEDFESALQLEDERLIGEVERMSMDPTYESFCHRHHSHRHRGEYAQQLQRILDNFDRSQVHVMESEAFFQRPQQEFTGLLDFLGLHAFAPADFQQHNARPSASMPADAREQLRTHFRQHDEQLADILGRRPNWAV